MPAKAGIHLLTVPLGNADGKLPRLSLGYGF